MRVRPFGYALATLFVALSAASLSGQTGSDPAAAHVKAAQAAAGTDYTDLFTALCAAPPPAPAPGATPAPQAPAGDAGRAVPDRATWYAEPVKVFDNLYFVGQSEYSVWAVNTSEGIILVDTIFGYSVKDEVTDGLKKLGLDPARIKYAIVSHGHADHSGGAKYIQDTYGARIIASAEDWTLMEQGPDPKPKRDMVATDGMKVTLGDTTLTVYLTPGHTKGTISTIIPVRDNGRAHTAVVWGGTLFNWTRGGAAYITPTTPYTYWFDLYSASAQKFKDIAAKANVDVLLSNHTAFDGSKTKLPAVQKRQSGAPNPYVIGNAAVQRFLTMAGECAQAGAIRYKGR